VIVLKNGLVEFDGSTDEGIKIYEDRDNGNTSVKIWDELSKAPGNEYVRLKEVCVLNKSGQMSESFDIRKPIGVKMKYEVLKDNVQFTHGLNLYSSNGVHILSSHDIETGKNKRKFQKGTYEATAWIPGNFLAEGYLTGSVALMSYDPFQIHLHEHDVFSFYVKDTIEGDSARGVYGGSFPGLVRPIFDWETKTNSQ
jgi:lipopolysaccharide transport system ATP-binding protein